MFKVIIAGSRDFDDYELLCKKLDKILENKTQIKIVSGTAEGADKLGERYAKERNLPIAKFPANWNEFGKAAGPMRNKEMAVYADACVVFMKKEGTKGSQNMIDTAKKEKLILRVITF